MPTKVIKNGTIVTHDLTYKADVLIDGGKIIGKTDRIGGEPITSPVSPLMVGTTIAEAMGIDSEARAKLRVLAGGSVVDDLLS